MIELHRHIEILLLDNDCVIIPDFGGFMAHHVEARYDDGDHTFLPPTRTLGFIFAFLFRMLSAKFPLLNQ